MSAPEIGFRFLDAGRRLYDRGRTWRFDAPADIASPIFPGLANGVARLELIDQWRATYRQAAEGRFSWFGVRWPQADPPDWHLDPMSGLHWSDAVFGPAIPYRHEGRHGDVKCVWELNRLQYLQPIAALASVTGETGPADLVRRHIADWVACNPPYRGINWSSGIEIGLRAVSLIFAGALVDLGNDLRQALAESLMAHGQWLERYPSRYSSANNHAIAEALGLLAIATAMPGLAEAARWTKRGRRIMERQSRRQIHPDGVGSEQAIAYHCFTLEMLALAARMGASTTSRFEASGAFLRAVTDSAGHAPGFGDDDESRLFWSPPGPEHYALAMQQAIGAIAVAPTTPHLRQALLEHGDTVRAVADGMTHFPDGGYTAVRDGPIQLLFDHGPLGYLSIAAHGHADALSIWLSIDGEPVLIDAGTYRYHGAGAVRDRFRGTAAHNTLNVAGADQSEIAGPFNWSRKAACKVLSMTTDPWSIEAEHDGYYRRFGCIHRRLVQTIGPSRFRVTDRLVGKGGPWRVSAGFLVAPGNEIRYHAGIWNIGKTLKLEYNGLLRSEIVAAEYSPSMGHIESTQRLCFNGMMGNSDLSQFDFYLAQ